MEIIKPLKFIKSIRLLHRFRWYFARWFLYWAMLIDAIGGILTLGFIGGSITLKADSWFLDITKEDFKDFGGYV